MNRRHFLMCTAVALAAPSVVMAAGGETLDYVPGLIEEKLAAGETVLVDFAADWCSAEHRSAKLGSF